MRKILKKAHNFAEITVQAQAYLSSNEGKPDLIAITTLPYQDRLFGITVTLNNRISLFAVNNIDGDDLLTALALAENTAEGYLTILENMPLSTAEGLLKERGYE